MNSKSTTSSISVSAPAFLDLYDALVSQNVIESNANIGVKREDLFNLEKRIPASMQVMLWDLAKKNGAPEHIGLIVGSQINEDAKGMLSNLISCASDLKEALDFFERYMPAMSEYETIQIQSHSWGYRIFYHGDYDQDRDICSVERSLSSLLTWGRYLTGHKFYPIKVSVRHKRPSYSEQYSDIFGSQILFGQQDIFLDISNDILNYEVISSNPFVKSLVVDHIDKFVSSLKKTESLPSKVKLIIEQNLEEGGGSSTEVSEMLNMSRQTLHRKLKEYDVSFRDLLEEVRKNRAVECLRNPDLGLEDIGFLLGFKEPSAFYRAFKNWFNESPGCYRKKILRN